MRSKLHISPGTIAAYIARKFGRDASSLEGLAGELGDVELDDAYGKLRDAILNCLPGASCHGWVEDLFKELYSSAKDCCGVMTEAIMADGSVVLVKDGHGVGFDGLWFVQAEKLGAVSSMLREFRGLPFSSMSSHVVVGDETYCIRAVSLSSCLKPKKMKI